MAHACLNKNELNIIVKAVEFYCHEKKCSDYLPIALKVHVVKDSNENVNLFDLKPTE